jgi:AraC family transcriptional regulator
MATARPKFNELLECGCEAMAVLIGRLSPGSYPEEIHAEIELAIPGERAAAEVTYRTAGGESRRRSVSDRHVSVIPAGQPHQVEWRRDADLTVLLLSPSFVEEIALDSGMKRVELVEEYAAFDPVIWHLGREMRTELRHHRKLEIAHLESLAMVVARHVLKTYASMPWSAQTYGGLPRYKLRRALEYIRENIDNDISFRDIAAYLDMSAYHFARMFKHSTGEPPHKYIVRCRVNRAKELLADTRLPIADVAFEVGYKSQSHFTTCFGKMVGLTPAAFRAGA